MLVWAAFARTPRISAPAPCPQLGESHVIAFYARRHPKFDAEMIGLLRREPREYRAAERAISRLLRFDDALGFPHSSGVRSSAVRGLRELRPRQGRSRWRPLYVIAGDEVRMIALAPEATHDPVGFRRAVDRAEDRLGEMAEQET